MMRMNCSKNKYYQVLLKFLAKQLGMIFNFPTHSHESTKHFSLNFMISY
jgi:hypothetical protein